MSADTLAVVIETIRTTLAEDWIADYDIDAATTFNHDLEIESIEFVKIADALQRRFGTRVDLAGWLSGKSLEQLITLSVGDLADFLATARG